MKRIRLGNTIDIVWEIFLGKDKDKGKYDLTGKKLTIYLVSAFDRIKISDFTTEFNVLRFTFEGKDQKHAGRYQLTFVENEGGDDTRTLDKCDAFELVRGSCMETDDLSEITLASSFDALRIYPIIPQVGPNRNWWVDGVDTGKSSVGLTAYEFAKEQGYEGTEEEYAAECLAVPVLNEESRTVTAEARVATGNSITQQEEISSYMKDVAEPTIERATAAAASANEAAEKANEAAGKVEEAIEAFGSHNIGSIDLFEQIIAERRNHNLTQEDKDAILSGKIITTSVGNGVVPTISSNSMGENGAVLIFHFNERLYEMFVMWTDTLCYINGVFSFTKETKLYADSELSEISENAVQNKVVTEKLAELSEEMSSFILEDGGIDKDGNDMENSVLCRTNFLPCNNGSILSGYIYRVAQYDENYSYLGQIIPTNEYSYTDSLVISNESCAFVRISVLTQSRTKANLKVDGTSVLYIADSNSILLYKKISKKIESPITTDKLEDGSVTLQKTAFSELGKNLFNKDNYKIGLLSNGNIYDTSDTYKAYLTSDYISVVAGENYVYSNQGVAKVLERAEVYDKDKKFLVSVANQGKLFTIPSNGAFFRFSIKTTTDSETWQTSQFEKGRIATEYEPYGYKIAKSVLPTIANKAHEPYLSNYAETLLGGATLEISNAPNAKTNHTIGCGMSIGTMGRIRISHGRATYAFGVVEIDATYVYEFTSDSFPTPTKTTPHGLMLKDLVRVVVRKDSLYGATIILTTASGEYTQQITWRGCTDAVVLYAMSGEYNNVSLTIGGNGFKKDIWIYGDSYADYWLPNLYDKEITDFYADAYSGRKSASAYTSFINALKLGTPKTLVWMMGMNDGDKGTINADYKGAFDAVKALCETHGIAFVPCTIPNCSQTHIYKNDYIRANAENYIDMAKILGADSEGSTWYDGLISSDNVHPSNQGKAVIANALIEYVF